ncbi:MAG TPA: hypothetical protein DHV28_09865 [Ignavibacteriales bacterium]|nr:hypothetical protein [Ignavibacteriales bacterium]
MNTKYTAILILLSLSFVLHAQNENLNLLPDDNFPLWLKTNQSRTDQTSGIAFIKSECNKKYFLLADDIGFIHLLTLHNDSIYSIEDVSFVDSAANYFSNFPKQDFEEIAFDKNNGSVFLSVEGNGINFNDYVGIYKLIFKDNDVFSKQIVSIEKLVYKPASLFYKYTKPNIGYEGFAIDENYFYLGLEGFLNNYIFADSTLIFVCDKSNLNIIKTISTKKFGIQTVCGLFSDNNNSLWGIDRNNRKIFHLDLDDELNIKSFSKYDALTYIPSYHNLNFLPSYESITIDDDNNLYIVDDPWKEVFIPNPDILDKLDEKTISNFKMYVPTILKYKITKKELSN